MRAFAKLEGTPFEVRRVAAFVSFPRFVMQKPRVRFSLTPDERGSCKLYVRRPCLARVLGHGHSHR